MSEKEILQDWILITYDIPRGRLGHALRHWLVRKLRGLGAMMFTESVYYLPHSQKAYEAITRLEGRAKFYVWRARLTEPEDAREVTKRYRDERKILLSTLKTFIDSYYKLDPTKESVSKLKYLRQLILSIQRCIEMSLALDWDEEIAKEFTQIRLP